MRKKSEYRHIFRQKDLIVFIAEREDREKTDCMIR